MKSFLLFGCLLLSHLAMASKAPAAPPGGRAVLPLQFGGWQTTTVQKSTNPAVADAANALPLKEYGFTDFATAIYTRNRNEKLTIRAARFADASGAYGAFTFYREPAMLEEQIGNRGASWNNRVLFFNGNILIDAIFEQITAMSAAELRELSSDLPLPSGNAGNLPTLPSYLPQQSSVPNSAKYVLGPATLAAVGAPVSSQMVDFSSGAEVMLGKFATSNGEATLMVIDYPTPQIAAQELRRFNAAQTASPPTLPSPLYDRRTGPLVVATTGAISQSEAKALLASVNYEANVTWNENTYLSKKDNIGNLIVNIIILCAIIGGLAIVAGIAFGGLRLLIKRFWPGRIFDRPEDVEFIALRIEESVTEIVEEPTRRA